MAEQTPQNLQQFTQGKPIAGFHQTRTLFWVGVSAVIHVILILGLSGRYLQDHVLDPAGADLRKQRDAERDAALVSANSGAPAPTAATQPARSTATQPGARPSTTEETMLKDKADTPVVKKMSETAKPNEIPAKPDDLGISLDETNKK